ncbi:serine hydrolase domain-containing protein [Portibacter marinus]|uniref:serine hydrolase domain-containing protein n=1 Tax=Portibacter marinus TaxID=2898660 RepID=UPI001F43A121|nr:serine hydrolase domain-containing protein [Portibacter marinus]
MKALQSLSKILLIITSFNNIAITQSFNFELDSIVLDLMNIQKVPGVILALIENGKLIKISSYGYADFDKKLALQSNHGFNVGSISKTFTAWGIMKLVEEEKIDLSDSVSKFELPCLGHIDQQDLDQITIRDLLQHTAGLSVHGYEGYNQMQELPSVCESLQGLKRKEEKVFVEHPSGSTFQYSGGGYTILQMIITKVSGIPFTHFMEKELFRKLDMKNTTFLIDHKVLERSASIYDTSYHQLSFEYFTAQAAAGLQTSIEDMSKFVLAHFTSNEVISSESISILQEGSQQSKNNYASGYMIMERFGSFTLHGHGGSNDGWQAGMMIDMKHKSGFIMLTNGMNGKAVIFPTLMKWGIARKKRMEVK